MKLLIINQSNIQTYFFTPEDSSIIKERCKAAGKHWGENLLGFFININDTTDEAYAAITVKSDDGQVECMEYIDIEKSKPEFEINSELFDNLSKKVAPAEITLTEFETVLHEILRAPLKARKWEVYPEINRLFPKEH